MKVNFTEEDLIKGLRLFRETTERYPSTMDMQTVMGEFSQGLLERKEALKDSSKMKNFESVMETISAMFGFYGMRVAKQQDPAYYGEDVTPADTHSVLLRWKLDDGQYRVIYGDLHAETVSAERLDQLENQ